MRITAIRVLGDTGHEYTVTTSGDEVTCTCPDNRFRGGVCKHMRFAAEQLGLVG